MWHRVSHDGQYDYVSAGPYELVICGDPVEQGSPVFGVRLRLGAALLRRSPAVASPSVIALHTVIPRVALSWLSSTSRSPCLAAFRQDASVAPKPAHYLLSAMCMPFVATPLSCTLLALGYRAILRLAYSAHAIRAGLVAVLHHVRGVSGAQQHDPGPPRRASVARNHRLRLGHRRHPICWCAAVPAGVPLRKRV